MWIYTTIIAHGYDIINDCSVRSQTVFVSINMETHHGIEIREEESGRHLGDIWENIWETSVKHLGDI